jgi:hypothetical protein
MFGNGNAGSQGSRLPKGAREFRSFLFQVGLHGYRQEALAVLVGGALVRIIGALVAIPAAAAVRLLLHEVSFRRLDVS